MASDQYPEELNPFGDDVNPAAPSHHPKAQMRRSLKPPRPQPPKLVKETSNIISSEVRTDGTEVIVRRIGKPPEDDEDSDDCPGNPFGNDEEEEDQEGVPRPKPSESVPAQEASLVKNGISLDEDPIRSRPITPEPVIDVPSPSKLSSDGVFPASEYDDSLNPFGDDGRSTFPASSLSDISGTDGGQATDGGGGLGGLCLGES